MSVQVNLRCKWIEEWIAKQGDDFEPPSQVEALRNGTIHMFVHSFVTWNAYLSGTGMRVWLNSAIVLVDTSDQSTAGPMWHFLAHLVYFILILHFTNVLNNNNTTNNNNTDGSEGLSCQPLTCLKECESHCRYIIIYIYIYILIEFLQTRKVNE